MPLVPEHEDEAVSKMTRRYAGLNPTQTATKLREKYTHRVRAIQRFTERLARTSGWVDGAEIETLRAVGVSEDEIRRLVEMYAKRG
jgi:alkylhydroperoxidase family enzyme